MNLYQANKIIHFIYQISSVGAYSLPKTDQQLVVLPKNSFIYYMQTFVYISFLVYSQIWHLHHIWQRISLGNLGDFLLTFARIWDTLTAIMVIVFNLRARNNIIRIYNKIIKFDQQLKKYHNISYRKLQILTWCEIILICALHTEGLIGLINNEHDFNSILNFGTTYITMTVISFTLYQHFNFTYLLYQRYSVLNNLTESISDIEFVTHSYKKLLTLTYLVHGTYEIQAFFAVTCQFLWLFTNFYCATIVFYKNPKYNIDVMEPLSTYIYWITTNIIKLLAITLLNFKTKHAGDKFVPLFCSMLTRLKDNHEISRYNLLPTRYVNNEISFKLLDLFELNLSVLISVFVALSYYVTLLIGYDK